jgi:pantothenate kinase
MADHVTTRAAVQGFLDRVAGCRGGRTTLGIAGAPGAGKSTLAHAVHTRLTERGIPSAVVPMDGFHLADVTLTALGLLARKGAPETFDADGYANLLRRLRDRPERTVYAPGFERDLEQPIAAAIAVEPGIEVVITEGNYLLLDQGPWAQVAALLDERWFVKLDDHVRRSRLVHRHARFGKAPDAAARWVDEVDEPNALLVQRSRGRADLLVRGD